jgi:hypothetical protein
MLMFIPGHGAARISRYNFVALTFASVIATFHSTRFDANQFRKSE